MTAVDRLQRLLNQGRKRKRDCYASCSLDCCFGHTLAVIETKMKIRRGVGRRDLAHALELERSSTMQQHKLL